jgi:hypothetical protein
MTDSTTSPERLAVVQLGRESFGVPLSDILYFVPAGQLVPSAGEVVWVRGGIQNPGNSSLAPVLDLAELWRDGRLACDWTHLILTRAGLAFGVGGYRTTGVLTIHSLRPSPGNPALVRAVIISDRPVAVIDSFQLVSIDMWRQLAPPA